MSEQSSVNPQQQAIENVLFSVDKIA